MAFDVSALVDYVDETSEELILAAQFTNKTATFANKQTGVKAGGKSALQIFDSAITLASGTACGFTAVGTDVFTQRIISAGHVAVNKEWCLKDLYVKWTQFLLNPGTPQDKQDVPQQIIDDVMMRIQDAVEIEDWQGDTGVTSIYDGLATIIKAATGVIDGNPAATTTAFDETNAFARVQELINAIPSRVYTEPLTKVFIGTSEFRFLVTNMLNDNNFHYTGRDVDYLDGSLILPGTGINVEAVGGLDLTDEIFAINCPKNMHLGVDMEGESEEFKVWYSMDDDVFRLKTEFSRGWQIARPEEIVKGIYHI